ncbi:tol-pal system protein YbgF [Enterovirga sp.]|uniref:tol-pal system protein YbgF n=1 Tax=Enterovirga sp. TaxID=2026350 RepID=UPI00262CEF39|nr:tol-pal system protein YbgF [Enterovirga sp.]
MIRRPLLALLLLIGSAGALRAQDATDFVVRLNRVEGQMRQLSGQVEQLQFENRQLKEQLRKFQEDVEFRFQERGGNKTSAPPAAAPAPRTEKPSRRSDAFEPDTTPEAPGAPRQLGSTLATPERGEARGGGSPRGGGIAAIIEEDEDRPGSGRPLDISPGARGGGPASPAPRGPVVASSGGEDSRADYDVAYAYLMQKQYEQSEASFRRFVQAHPRDRLLPDAVFWLGESLLQRGRHREAAEQFLKVSTEHGRSAKAPDALLKLGISLAALGAKDQACATFAELERKHPGASASVKQGVDREQKRARCPA